VSDRGRREFLDFAALTFIFVRWELLALSSELSSAGEDMEARSIAHQLQHLYRIALELTPPGRDHFYRAAGSFQYRLKVPL
jgi:hypothetical protein